MLGSGYNPGQSGRPAGPVHCLDFSHNGGRRRVSLCCRLPQGGSLFSALSLKTATSPAVIVSFGTCKRPIAKRVLVWGPSHVHFCSVCNEPSILRAIHLFIMCYTPFLPRGKVCLMLHAACKGCKICSFGMCKEGACCQKRLRAGVGACRC